MNYLRLLQARRMAADGSGGGAGGAGGAGNGGSGGGAGTGGAGDGQGDDGADGDGKGDDGGKGKGEGEKTFTQAELDAIVTKRLAKASKDTEAKIAAAVAEGEKRGKMSAEERAEADRKANQKALEERERTIKTRELRASALETLAEKGLPKDLAEALNYSDEEALEKSMAAAEKAFRAAVQAGVKARLAGDGAPGGKGETGEDAYLAQMRAAAGLPAAKK
jgi:hypothetical protein